MGGNAKMVQTVEAIFDGAVLRPDEPLAIDPNTRVRVTIETLGGEEEPHASFLQTAQSLNLQGPADWSARFDDYLYGSAQEPSE